MEASAGPDDRRNGAPLVLVEKVGGALRIAAADPPALALGLTPGLTLADARARVPHLSVAPGDAAADAVCLERMAEACDRWTPLVAIDGPEGLMLDVTGAAHLCGGEASLRGAALALFGRAGFTARATMAGTPDAARALSRHGSIAIVPPGGEREAMRPLPIAALGLDGETAQALRRAGLRTVGDLDDRDRLLFAARFGNDPVKRLERALGHQDVRIVPRRPPPALIAERRFAEPIARVEDVEAAIASLIGTIGEELQNRGHGGRRFEVGIFRTDGAVRRLAVATGRPQCRPGTLMRLFRERIDALADPLDPGFGFDLLRLAVPVTEPLGTPQTSFDGQDQDEGEVADLVDRLVARLGPARVSRFRAGDTHDPDRAAALVPAGADTETSRDAGTPWPTPAALDPPMRPLRLFRPPQPIETLAEVPDGPPMRFRWRRVMHEVARAEGPERIAAEWWQKPTGTPTRDYYRVEDADGRRFWIYREGLYGRETNAPRWFLHGLFA